MADKLPPEIARDTLKLLSQRKLFPTPENYMALYREVAGSANVLPFPDEPLSLIAKALPAQNPGQQKQRALFELAVTKRDWSAVQNALVGFASFGVPPAAAPVPPPSTPIEVASAVPAKGPGAGVVQPGASGPAVTPLTPEFLDHIARFIEFVLPALGSEDKRFNEQATALLALMRSPTPDPLAIKTALSNFSHRASFAAEEQGEIKAGLLKLLHLIFKNIGELSLDDRWLRGQIDALTTASAPPLSLRQLDDVGSLLKDVIFKQTEAKGRAIEAQNHLRQMLGTFIERLSEMSRSSSGFHDRITQCAQKISAAQSLEEIAPVLETVINAAQTMARDSMRVRDELDGMRQKADAAQQQIVQLHQELDRISAQARHDPLTGALNRKGLDETMLRDVSDAVRKAKPLSMALLDIDNFKKLNDKLGHDAGDAALKHLAEVARACMRPQDSLARYGGEEFVILMPDTPLDAGIEAMTRLQRELTKRIFLERTEKILITFSAGVAQLVSGESGMETVKRADQAMYMAKRAGKNRVLGA